MMNIWVGLSGLRFKSIRKKICSINLEDVVNEFLDEHNGNIVDVQTAVSDGDIVVNILYREEHNAG